MKRILEKSGYLVLVGVLFSLIAALIAFLWGGIKTINIILSLFNNGGEPKLVISLIQLMEIFIIGTAFLIFAVGMYELFIKNISVPECLVIPTLDDLKTKLSSVIILAMVITFFEHLAERENPQGVLFYGIGVALVSSALIAFNYFRR